MIEYTTIAYACGSDEDAPPIAKPGLLIVADGLGARGARIVPPPKRDEGDAFKQDGKPRTNAYYGSRVCARAVEKLCTPDYVAQWFAALDDACASKADASDGQKESCECGEPDQRVKADNPAEPEKPEAPRDAPHAAERGNAVNPDEPAESAEPEEPGEVPHAAERGDAAEPEEPAQAAEPAEFGEPGESAENAEPAEPETCPPQDDHSDADAHKPEPPAAPEDVLRALATEIGLAVQSELLSFWDTREDMLWVTDGTNRILPTTLVVMLLRENKDDVEVITLWCGDSRGYALTSNGLMQLTNDHLNGDPNAYELVKNDRTMTRFVNLLKDYAVSVRHTRIPKPCLLFAASDGAFMYLKLNRMRNQPNALLMEYYLLLEMNKPTLAEAAEGFRKCVANYTEDDSTLAMAACYEGEYADSFLPMIRERRNAFMTYVNEWKTLDIARLGSRSLQLAHDHVKQCRDEYALEVREALPAMISMEDDALRDNPLILRDQEMRLHSAEAEARKREPLLNARKEAERELIAALPAAWVAQCGMSGMDAKAYGDANRPNEPADAGFKLDRALVDFVMMQNNKGMLLCVYRLMDKRRKERAQKELNLSQISQYRVCCDTLRAEIAALDTLDGERLQAAYMLNQSPVKPMLKRCVQCAKIMRALRGSNVTALHFSDEGSRCAERLSAFLRPRAVSLHNALLGVCGEAMLLGGDKTYDEAYRRCEETVAALEDFDARERQRQTEEYARMYARLIVSSDELCQWLMERGHPSGPKREAYARAQKELERVIASNDVFGSQWERYRAAYERVLRTDSQTGETIHTPEERVVHS